MSEPTLTLCDTCGREVPEDEAQTCSCGQTVCDECFERGHYMCADEDESSCLR